MYLLKTLKPLILVGVLLGANPLQANPVNENQLTKGWLEMEKKLPPEMASEFREIMTAVLQDPAILNLKKKSLEAQKAARSAQRDYRQAVQKELALKNPAIAERVDLEISKLKTTAAKTKK